MNQHVEMVKIPQASSVGQMFPLPDYMDAFAVDIPDGVELDIERIARNLIFKSAPWWVDALMSLRNAVVKCFGLKTGDMSKEEAMRRFSLSNPDLGGFKIYEHSDHPLFVRWRYQRLAYKRIVCLMFYLLGSLRNTAKPRIKYQIM